MPKKNKLSHIARGGQKHKLGHTSVVRVRCNMQKKEHIGQLREESTDVCFAVKMNC